MEIQIRFKDCEKLLKCENARKKIKAVCGWLSSIKTPPLDENFPRESPKMDIRFLLLKLNEGEENEL